MPSLIDLKTDLKSLRYGKDTLGGGYSGQPYIQTSIPDGFNNLGANEDFILRGGINTVRDSVTDVERLTKMFTDTKSPNGLLFIAKQQLLSRTAVRTQVGGLLNEGIYSELNTLAQAGVVAFGTHLNKQGINPFAQTGAYSNNNNLYFNAVKPNPNSPEESTLNNRLVSLTLATTEGRTKRTQGFKLNDGVNVLDYTGGPGSNLGIGRTGIRYMPESALTLLKKKPTSFSTSQNTWTYSSVLVSKPYSTVTPLPDGGSQNLPGPTKQGSLASPKIQDFRAILRTQIQGQDRQTAKNAGALSLSPGYVNNNGPLDLRTNYGQPGQRGRKSYANYSLGVLDTDGAGVPQEGTAKPLDQINSLSIYRSQNVDTSQPVNDLVKFRIAVIDNDSPNFKTFMHFRALLGSMSDAYNSTWNGVSYLGRGEQFYTYGGFTRNISLSWTVAAQSKEELIPMYKKLNYLASTLTPDYGANGYMKGNLVQLTIGGYLYEQPGFITGLTYEIQEDTPWEIGIGVIPGSQDATVKELPHIIRVTGFSFTPIQRFVPSLQDLTFSTNATETTGDDTGPAQSYGNQRFIALANGDTTNDQFSNYNYYKTK